MKASFASPAISNLPSLTPRQQRLSSRTSPRQHLVFSDEIFFSSLATRNLQPLTIETAFPGAFFFFFLNSDAAFIKLCRGENEHDSNICPGSKSGPAGKD